MTEFERGIERALSIYKAGVLGQPVPKYKNMRPEDIRALYTAGYEDALDEISAASDRVTLWFHAE